MAWEPGWSPAALSRLVRLCDDLKRSLEPAVWQMACAEMLVHPLHRLMLEDPLIRAAQDLAGRPGLLPLLQDLLLRHETVRDRLSQPRAPGATCSRQPPHSAISAPCRGSPPSSRG
ncbi:hypothetical protein [Teichococcus aestuarii]|uniref:hypothetical protein n=1 Tax=Teichococcus aestuarii TaxID=568898 RepID=UPI003616CCEC